MTSGDDLSVSGPGSPISLRKFLEKENTQRPLTVLIDGTGSGIDVDNAPVLSITVADCMEQADYFRTTFYEEGKIPKYIFDDFLIFYRAAIEELPESEQITFVGNLIKYLQSEARQILGLIILVRGSLSMAAKQNAGLKIYIEHPEAHMHPQRQSAFASWLTTLITPSTPTKIHATDL